MFLLGDSDIHSRLRGNAGGARRGAPVIGKGENRLSAESRLKKIRNDSVCALHSVADYTVHFGETLCSA